MSGHDCALRTVPLGVLGAMQAILGTGVLKQLAGQAKSGVLNDVFGKHGSHDTYVYIYICNYLFTHTYDRYVYRYAYIYIMVCVYIYDMCTYIYIYIHLHMICT